MKILIVEDNASLREMLHQMVTSRLDAAGVKNFIIREAASAEDALSKVWAAEAVLSDGLEGDWLKIYAVASKRGMRFVLYSGDPNQVNQAKLIGVRAFSKPMGTEDAIAALLDLPARRPEPLGGAPSAQAA
jgi:CheY-like chemotaxis protein